MQPRPKGSRGIDSAANFQFSIHNFQTMNLSLFYFLNNIGVAYPALDSLFVFLANNFGYLLIFVLLFYILEHDDKKRALRELAIMLAVAVFAWLVAHVIKYFYYMPRPFVALQNMHQLLPYEADSSFPSGHATFYSALALAMYSYHKRIAIVLALGALIIGIARIIVGVHFPVDILAGFILGPLVAYAVYFFLNKFKQIS